MIASAAMTTATMTGALIAMMTGGTTDATTGAMIIATTHAGNVPLDTLSG